MIAFAFFAVLAMVAVFYFYGFKAAGMINKTIVSGVSAVLFLIIGTFLWPISESYMAGMKNQGIREEAQAEADAAKTMITVLGSAENYIRYLETKKGK